MPWPSRTELSEATAVEALETATGLFTSLIPMAELARRATELAIRLKHPIYDGFYLALAGRENAPLISIDKKLIAAGRRTKGQGQSGLRPFSIPATPWSKLVPAAVQSIMACTLLQIGRSA